ncbi:MAG: hypothetical protein LBR54_00330 [Oscillospiraceae bacterium]|jgi:hypothetical protein|nr:hypothetical protein [Oscillospiraceae bacterium]
MGSTWKKWARAILIVAAILAAVWFGFSGIYGTICGDTKVERGLSATETVEKFFKYWGDGNMKGREVICVGTEPGSAGEKFQTSKNFDVNGLFCTFTVHKDKF